MKKLFAFELTAILFFTLYSLPIFGQSKPAADWTTVEAAKREGVVKCACPPRREFALAFKNGFEAAYPGITLEITAATLPAFPLRAAKEQAPECSGMCILLVREQRYSN